MRKRLAVMISTAIVLGGCSGLHGRIDRDVEETGARTHGLINNVGRSAAGVIGPDSGVVERDDGIWLGKQAVKLSDAPLPPIFYEPATFDRYISSLSELAERITLRSGIPTKVQQDAIDTSAQYFGMASSTTSAIQSTTPGLSSAISAAAMPMGKPGDVPSGQRLALPGATGRVASASSTGKTTLAPVNGGLGVRLNYSNGSFKGLLDTAAARFGVSWKYVDGVIQFFHTESRTYQINAIPGDSSFTATVNSASSNTGGVQSVGDSGGGGSGGSNSGSTVNSANTQSTNVVSKLSVYTGLESAIKVMLSPSGQVLASPATGAITVVDTPDSLDRIGEYLDRENKSLSRQVVINVTVLSVSVSDTDAYGINWAAVYQTLNRVYGFSSNYTTIDSASTLSAGVIGSSSVAGSGAIIQALATQGRVRRQTTASVVTLNNQPVPVQVARQTSYLAQATSSLVAQVGSTSSLKAGTVTSGFNMSILPHILNNGVVMLQFSTDISNLIGLRTITSGTSTIEVPTLDTRNFLQRVSMKSNETLIISGFEQNSDSNDRSGTITPTNVLLGGGANANAQKDVIVILITPVMLNAPT